jgi:hypothetical protein
MDMQCDYINKQGNCESPKNEGRETECSCSNYKQCLFYPQFKLRTKVPFERLSDLEKEVKE